MKKKIISRRKYQKELDKKRHDPKYIGCIFLNYEGYVKSMNAPVVKVKDLIEIEKEG